MKKSLHILPFILLFHFSSSAQTEKGTWLLGGSASYVRTEGVGFVSINPSVGYFLLNNLAGGAQVNFYGAKSGSYFSVGPFGRYYFYGDERGRFYLTAGLNIGFGSGSKFDTGFNLGGGYAMFLNESISINLGAQYDKIGADKGIFTLGAGFQIHFSG
jgi:outer membrane protein